MDFIQLSLHTSSLLPGIMSTEPDGGDPDKARKPKAEESKFLPAPVAFLLGCMLVVGSTKLLLYALDRGGYLMYIVFIVGFLPFCLGGLLIFFCFLPDPPPIFGFGFLIGS